MDGRRTVVRELWRCAAIGLNVAINVATHRVTNRHRCLRRHRHLHASCWWCVDDSYGWSMDCGARIM